MIDFYRKNPVIAAYDLLGVDLAPIQAMILEDMWFKSYVVTVTSRGLGKTFIAAVLAVLSTLLYPGYRVGLISSSFRQCFINNPNGIHTFFTSEGLYSSTDSFYESITCNRSHVQSLKHTNVVLNKWKNNPRLCRTIKTTKGLELGGTIDHRILTLSAGFSLTYKELKDIDEETTIVIRKGFNFFGNNISLPQLEYTDHWATKPCCIPKTLTPDLSYLLGLIVGDGHITTKSSYQVGFTSSDPELVDRFIHLMFSEFGLSKHYIQIKTGNCVTITYTSKTVCVFLLGVGLTDTTALDKKFPFIINRAPKDCILSFISALLDTDGCCYTQSKCNTCTVDLATSSIRLAKEYQAHLLNLGILAGLCVSKKAERRQLVTRTNGLSDCAEAYKVRITGIKDLILFSKVIGFKLHRKQNKLNNYLLENKPYSTSDKIPYSEKYCLTLISELRPLLKRGTPDLKFIGMLKNNTTKTKTGVTRWRLEKLIHIADKYNVSTESYCRLKDIISKDLAFVKPVSFITSMEETIDIEVASEHCYWASGFIHHNSKLIFAEVEKLYGQSSILQEACEKRPIRGADLCYLQFKGAKGQHGSYIEALPIGNDGAKIRGSRFYLLIMDEFAQIPKKIIDNVLTPMAVTKLNPMKRVRDLEVKKRLIAQGLAVESDFEEETLNKLVAVSSGYYKFNHMYRRMREYWKLMDLGSEHHVVHQVPYTALPDGFLDKENIDNARRTMSDYEFRMEYMADMVSDSDGFFKASLLLGCSEGSGFYVEDMGVSGASYIIGVDPNQGGRAKCGFVVIKLGTVCKVVQVFEFEGHKTQDIVKRVQRLCKEFNVSRIFMDRGGGGKAISDLLAEGYGGEEPIIDILEKSYEKLQGRRILEAVPSNPGWVAEANFATLALLEAKGILFPEPPLEAIKEETEDAYNSVELLKKQCLNIVITETSSGVLHFDTPKKGQNKDLYSAFVLACWGAKKVLKPVVEEDFQILHGSSGLIRMKEGAWMPVSGKSVVANADLQAAVLKRKIN